MSVLGGGRGVGQWAGLGERAHPLGTRVLRPAAASQVPPRSLPAARLSTARSSSPDSSRPVPGAFPEDAVRGAGAGAVRAAARPGRARRAAAAAAGGAQRGPAAQQGEEGPRTPHLSGTEGAAGGSRRGGEGEDSVILLELQETRSIYCPGRLEGRWWMRVCGWAGEWGPWTPRDPAAPRSGEQCWSLGVSSEQEGSSVYKHFSTQKPSGLVLRLCVSRLSFCYSMSLFQPRFCFPIPTECWAGLINTR